MDTALVNNPLVSVVLPCLNEEKGIQGCIEQITQTFVKFNIKGEIVVVDNGSTDQSASIARGMGVRVVEEPIKGYGRAYQRGFKEARGEYFIMGDADLTYDFGMIPDFLMKLQSGFDFVTGSRFKRSLGGSGMPWLHQFLGNPLLTKLLNLFFGTRYSDVYCGLRGFSKKAYDQISPVSPGMEFNLELAINAHLARLKIAELPITLGPRAGESKLRTFQDGWRSLRMILLYCPNKVFFAPGLSLSFLGLLLHTIIAMKWVEVGGRPLAVTSSIFATVFSVVGFQIMSLGLHAKTYSWSRRYDSNKFLERFYNYFTFEKGILLGLGLLGLGSSLLLHSVYLWSQGDFHPLTHPESVSLAATLFILGTLVTFTSLFISAMSMEKQIDVH